MSAQTEITLRAGDASPNDIRLYALPVLSAASIVIFLYAGAANANDVVLSDPATLRPIEEPSTGQPYVKRCGGVPFMALPGRCNVWAPCMALAP